MKHLIGGYSKALKKRAARAIVILASIYHYHCVGPNNNFLLPFETISSLPLWVHRIDNSLLKDEISMTHLNEGNQRAPVLLILDTRLLLA